MKSRHRSTFSLSSPLVAVAVGILCVAYIQLTDSAPTSESSKSTTTTRASSTSGTKPTRITTLRTGKQREIMTEKPRVENAAGRLKASDIKACISKAFCEVNSASRKPNYAVNQEFFDIMDQIRALSDEELDSGSVSVEYDEDEEEEDDDVESSEESSSERGYAGPPPPGYHRMGKKMKNGGNDTSITTDSATNSTVSTVKKVKSKGKNKDGKKKMKVKTVKKYVNGTFISVPKRRHSRIETDAEKAEKVAYVTRKQREMGQVNDLAALIRISADIGLTLRSPRKCRTLFNKCTMTHEQIVDLFNQTLMAVTTPSSDNANVVSSSTTKVKVHTTQAAPAAEEQATELVEITTASQAPSTTSASTTTSPITTTIDNRSSKSRHDFSDEDIEYMTDTEIQPVATYALFVNDPVDDTMKTAETDVNVQETFKKYANTFPAEASYPVDLPTLRKKSSKVSRSKRKKSSFNRKLMAQKQKASSEEDEEDEDEEEDDDPVSASSTERKSGFRIESPYPGYRVNAKDEEGEPAESAEPSSLAKESSEGILPPLVQKTVPVKNNKVIPSEDDEDADEDEENDEESEESVEEVESRAKQNKKYKKNNKSAPAPASPAPVEEEESSEEDDVETADDDQQSPPPPWTPVYQMYMNQKQKQGYKKKQKGPYKGGEHPYDDSPHHEPSSAKKPWAGGAGSHELGGVAASSHESMYGDAPYHGGPPYGGAPPSSSQEVGAEKPGFFQSIMSWFTGGNKNGEQSPDSPYPPAAMTQHQHGGYSQQQSPTGSPWPSQPDPANVGHYQYEHHPHHHHTPSQYRHRDSSEDSDEDDVEEVEAEEFLPKKKKNNKSKRRRYRGRSDSIINSELKKPTSSSSSRKTGPPAPVVVVPKETKPASSGSNSGVGVYEPNSHYDTLIKADGGITAGSNLKGKNSGKANKRTKKETIKPKQKKNQKQTQRAHGSNESHDDDDEAYSSEELFNRQVQKLKSEKVGASNSASSNGKQNNNNNDASTTTETSFPKYFESMFGNEKKKDPFKPSGKDDGSLLYGFDLLSSTLSATPMDLPAIPKKKGTYKINKTKKKKKGTSPPVTFNQKEVINSSEENEEKKKK